MRRLTSVLLVLFLLVFFLFLLLPLFRAPGGITSRSEIDQVSRALGADVSAGTVAAVSDSHGGFHGDGLTFMEITFPDDGFGSGVQNQWQALPLSGNLQALVYGVSGVGPYITRDGAACFPRVQNGYYYFEGRQAEGADSRSDFALFRRASYNVTVAVYDTDARTLYYCAFDT